MNEVMTERKEVEFTPCACNHCGKECNFSHQVDDKHYCGECAENIYDEYRYYLECD